MEIAQALNVNGKTVSVAIDDPQMPLLYALRNNLGLHGPRFGCGLGQCGACTVHVEGKAVRSCHMPLSQLKPGTKIVTLEGLGTPENPHPVQRTFIDEQAVQCGYCINGMIMESAAFLAANKKPSRDDIKRRLPTIFAAAGRMRASFARSCALRIRVREAAMNTNILPSRRDVA